MPELGSPAAAHCFSKRWIRMIDKILKWSIRSPFFALKQHRYKWAENDERSPGFDSTIANQRTDAITDRAIADLIVVLQVRQKFLPVQIPDWSSVLALAMFR